VFRIIAFNVSGDGEPKAIMAGSGFCATAYKQGVRIPEKQRILTSVGLCQDKSVLAVAYVGGPSWRTVNLKPVGILPGKDICSYELIGASCKPLPLARIGRAQELMALGYPAQTESLLATQAMAGTLKGSLWISDVLADNGMSGGPGFSVKEKVVGIVRQGHNESFRFFVGYDILIYALELSNL